MIVTINQTAKYQGFFRIQVNGPDGTIKTDTGWFPNLITNQGLDWIGGGAPVFNVANGAQICTHCGVGTGNTAPAFTDTQLTSFLAMYPASAGSNIEGFSSSQYVSGSPAYWSGIFTYTFAQGAVVGNIAEVGTGNTASGNTQPQLFSHALILDGSGNPTTISVTSADALTVTYELRVYLNLTDNTYSINISGTNYSGTYRMANVTVVPPYWLQLDNNPGGTTGWNRAYNGTIQAVTGEPNGTSANANSITTSTYNAGSYYKSFSTTYNTATANLSGGISALKCSSNLGQWQFSVSPTIPKDNLHTLTINYNVSWSRYP